MQFNSAAKPRKRIWDKFIAFVAVINLLFVIFDLSYIPLREYYLQFAPEVTQYDVVKAIRPHRETENYLDMVSDLEEIVDQFSLPSSQADILLGELRRLSDQMINDNPFEGAGKSSTFEKIQEEMRLRTNESTARDAFMQFWSLSYLSEAGWQEERSFFNQEIRPLLVTNYYRDVNLYGKFISYFWQIDLPFNVLFGLDFLVRTFSLSRRKPKLNWPDVILRRWYDWFLFIPVWRWLRVIPVFIRLYQSRLLNLEPVRRQINYDFAVGFAEELIELVGIQIIDQMQDSIRRGDLAEWLFRPESRRSYIQVNNRNEVKAIASRLIQVSIYDVLPKIQPDIQALLQYSFHKTLDDSPAYRQLEKIPGLTELPTKVTEKLAHSISQGTYTNLVQALEDPVAIELTARLTGNFQKTLEAELQKQKNLQEIESLLIDMLEEIKINYVKNVAQGGIDKILEEADQLQEIIDSYQASGQN